MTNAEIDLLIDGVPDAFTTLARTHSASGRGQLDAIGYSKAVKSG